MDQDLVASLVEELHVSEDLVRIAVTEARGELIKARAILEGLLPRHLFIKARFTSKRADGSGGLILIATEKGADKFHIFRTVFDRDRTWLRSINVRRSPESFYQLISDYFEKHEGGRQEFDAQQLKDRLSGRLSPAGLTYLFELWDVPKTQVLSETDPLDSYNKPGAILYSLLKVVLGEILVDQVDIAIDYDFYTDTQLNRIRASLDLAPKPVTGAFKLKVRDQNSELKIHLKGQFNIDPVNGVPVHQLEPGDSVYCEIIDRKDISASVGRAIGAYKHGLWLPVKGRILEVTEAIGDRRRFNLILARGVYIDVLSFSDILVRTTELRPRERVRQAQPDHDQSNSLPLLVAVVLLAILVIIVLLTR